MIELDDYEINAEIIRTIDKHLRECGNNIEYLDIYQICHELVSNLYDAEKDKYEEEN